MKLFMECLASGVGLFLIILFYSLAFEYAGKFFRVMYHFLVPLLCRLQYNLSHHKN